MLRRWVELVIARPRVTIFLILVLTAGLLARVDKLQIQLEPDAQIPPNHRLVKIGQKIQKEFGGKYVGLFLVRPKKGTIYTPKIFKKLKNITEQANKLKGLRQNGVVSLVADNVRDIRSSAGGLEVKPYVETMPETEADFAELRKRIDHNQAVTAMLVSDNGRTATVSVDFDDFEAAGGSTKCHPSLEKIAAAERDDETDIIVTGMPALVYWFLVYTERVNYVFFLSLLMIGWLQFRTFRTFQGMFIPLVTALLGVGWTLGMMGWTGLAIDPWNGMTPILVLAIAAGHSTQILKRYYEEYNRIRAEKPDQSPRVSNREAVVEATTKVGAVMLAAGGIAAVSFGSLVTFQMPSVQAFGKAVSFGIASSLLIEMSFIPALRSLLPAPTDVQSAKEKKKAFFDPLLYWLADMMRTSRDGWIIPAFGAVLAIALVGGVRMQVNNSMDAQFYGGPDFLHRFMPSKRREVSFLDAVHIASKKTAGSNTVFIRVEANEKEGIKDPAVLRAMEQVENFVKSRSAEFQIGNVLSLVDFMKLMNRVMNDDDSKQEVLPTTRDLVAQYLFLYSMSGPGGDIERFVDFDYQRSVMTIYMRTDDNNLLARLIDLVRAEIARAFKGTGAKADIGGGNAYLVALNEVIVHDKMLNMAQVLSIIFVVTSLMLRSLVGGLMVVLPLFNSILVNFGVMGWFTIWLSMGTATISAIAAGIGADYAIYFIFRMREELARGQNKREAAAITATTSGKAVVSVALAIATGYMCLPLSGFKLHGMVGLLMPLMMVSSCLGAVALMPSILVRIRGRFLTRGLPVAGQKK